MSIVIVILSLFLQYVDSLFVCLSEKTWSKAGDIVQRRQTSYDIARILLMVPFEPWENFTPFFGAAAFCTTEIDNFRASLTLTSSTTLSAY